MTTILTLSGQPGSGTTTVATTLEDRLDATYVNAGTIFRSLADAEGMSLDEFSKHVNENPAIDRSIDYQLRDAVDTYLGNTLTAEKPEVADDVGLALDIDTDAEYMILESRLAGWITGVDADLRVWCHAPLDVRCNRLTADGDGQEDPDELVERQNDEAMRYDNWYDIDITDTSIYDLVVNTARWDAATVADMIVNAVDSYDPTVDEGATRTHSPFTRGA